MCIKTYSLIISFFFRTANTQNSVQLNEKISFYCTKFILGKLFASRNYPK